MKMQIAFRETGTQRAGYRVAIAGGIVETHSSDRLSYDECHMPFDLSCHGDGTVMLAYCHRHPTRIAYDEIHLEMETLEGLLARDMSRMRPSPFANAEFALRETALKPGKAGGMVYAFSGFYYLDQSTTLDFTKVYQLESRDESGDHVMMRTGVLGQDVRPELAGIDAVADMRGHSMTELLKKPWWGFGDEPTSLPGTMRKGIYEQLDRLHHLHFVENERDSDEYRYLLDRMRSDGTCGVPQRSALREIPEGKVRRSRYRHRIPAYPAFQDGEQRRCACETRKSAAE